MKANPYRGEKGQRNREVIVTHFDGDPDDWISISELATITGCSANTARVHCYNLYTTGYLEETLIIDGDRYIQHFRKKRAL